MLHAGDLVRLLHAHLGAAAAAAAAVAVHASSSHVVTVPHGQRRGGSTDLTYTYGWTLGRPMNRFRDASSRTATQRWIDSGSRNNTSLLPTKNSFDRLR